MMKIVHVESAAEREQFCALTGLSTLTPENMEMAHPDAHWLLEGDNEIEARCSLWWNNTPSLPGERVGVIGHYAAYHREAAAHLLRLACTELAHRGCTLAVGPMDGSTHRRYRLLSERGPEPPFFLEPDNPDDWPEHFTANGFSALASYVSALQIGIERADPRVPKLAAHFADNGITLRTFDAEHFDDEVRRIYRVVAASFRENFLASPIGEDEFLEQYRPIQPYILPELTLLAERAGEPAGFIFAVPDWLQAQRRDAIDTLIVKTLAVRPELGNQGLATLLSGQLSAVAYELGYTRAIHALMHERNVSRRISTTHRGQIMRRYTLYARKLENAL